MRIATIILVALAFIAGMVLPVYTDEIGWRFQERAGLDGVDKLYSESCGLHTLRPPPAFMMPVRWYGALFNTVFVGPFWIRVSGVLYALAWLGMLVALVRRIAPDKADRDALTIAGVGLMGLGVMPLLLVWSRPEQPILLAMTAALLIALGEDRNRGSRIWLAPLAILACAAVALSYHFKALLLVPAFTACICLSPYGGRWSRLLALGLLAVATVAGARYWLNQLDCSGDPVLTAQRAAQSLGLRLASGGGGIFGAVAALLGNLDLAAYVKLSAPAPDPMSQWLPIGVSRGMYKAWKAPLLIAWGVPLVLSLWAVARGAWRGIGARRLDPRLVLAVLLAAAACAWTASQVIRNVYEASFVLPLLMLAFMLVLASGEGRWASRLLGAYATLIAIALPVSLAVVATLYGPSLWGAFGHRGYLDRQPYSLAVRGYADENSKIVAVARMCRIDADHPPGRLLVDELTYFPFIRSPLPQHWLGVLRPSSRGVIRDPIRYLESRGSGGIVVGCRHLPPDLLGRASRIGDYCCLAPPRWAARPDRGALRHLPVRSSFGSTNGEAHGRRGTAGGTGTAAAEGRGPAGNHQAAYRLRPAGRQR